MDASEAAQRREFALGAIRWCGISVAWALVAGGASLAAGLVANSVALVGFGCDSIIDGMASAVLVWRFRQELATPSRSSGVERLATRVIGITLLMVAAYLVVGAVLALVAGTGPSKTPIGTTLAAASLVILPILALKKLSLARGLHSRALHGDGVLSAAGGLLAGTTLLGLVLAAAVHWWWCDSAAALIIAGVLVKEAVSTLAQAIDDGD
jgi:divalent metal cation (Fe/Co/Zn/Cd) transporter